MANRRSLRQKPPLGAVPNFAHPLSQGLVGWWLFNEQGGIKANDISGRGNNGTLIGGPTWNNQALAFDGTDDYLTVPHSASLALTTNITVSLWINDNSLSSDRVLLAKSSTSGTDRTFWFYENGHIRWSYFNTLGPIIPSASITDGAWHHVVGTFNGTTLVAYLDGVQTGTPTAATPIADNGAAIGINSYVGGTNLAGAKSLDDVRIYNRALGANEIRALYETPFANIAMASRGNMFISGDTAAVTGTITSVTQSNIIAGGKTLILTLTGDTWVASGATFDAQRQAIINGVTSAQSEAFGWNAIPKTQQSVAGVVRTSDTVVTITWDAFATYDISTAETITVTIPSSALTGGVAIVATPTFSITPVFARRAFVLDNGTRLTSGRIPYSTGSNGLGDDSGLTYSTTTGITAPGFISNGVVRLKGYTVATLPSGTQGDTAFVTDANATTFNSVVAGGGSNVVSVFHNGTNWVIQ